MKLIDVFERDRSPELLFVFDQQTSLGNSYAMEMGREGWPWGWTSVPHWPSEKNEHLGRQLGAENLYEKLGEKVLGMFMDRLSVNEAPQS